NAATTDRGDAATSDRRHTSASNRCESTNACSRTIARDALAHAACDFRITADERRDIRHRARSFTAAETAANDVVHGSRGIALLIAREPRTGIRHRHESAVVARQTAAHCIDGHRSTIDAARGQAVRLDERAWTENA